MARILTKMHNCLKIDLVEQIIHIHNSTKIFQKEVRCHMLIDKAGNETNLKMGDQIWYDKFEGTVMIIRRGSPLVREGGSDNRVLLHEPGQPEINFLGFCELLSALCELEIDEVQYRGQLIICRFK